MAKYVMFFEEGNYEKDVIESYVCHHDRGSNRLQFRCP